MWLAIPVITLVIMLVFPRVVGGRPHSDPSTLVMGRWTVGSLTVVFAVRGWSLWSGFPELLGKAFLLTRVPGVRVPLALGLALLVLVVALNQLDLGRAGPRWLLPVVLVSPCSRQSWPPGRPCGCIPVWVRNGCWR